MAQAKARAGATGIPRVSLLLRRAKTRSTMLLIDSFASMMYFAL
jgi:hypothetical protein